MAGHSKWANIKHRKGAEDAKRAKVFTRLAKEIIVSAKLAGSDENSNPRLRAAVIKARAANMPKDNIERAIKKGAGELEGTNYEEITYEGYGPDGLAIMVEVMTDKKTRTLPEIKNLFSKNGGNLAETGAVAYSFEYKGHIIFESASKEDDLFELCLEAGASDFNSSPEEDSYFEVFSERDHFHSLLSALESRKEEELNILESGLKYFPTNTVELKDEKLQKAEKLLNALEDHDDVQHVFSNLSDQ
jgi:YebC/PmpR family DNA-binding regulatory protein